MRARHQRGVVLLFALIALVILLLGAVALTRGFQGSLYTAGNIGFKRDMQNRSELAVSAALAAFRGSGKLASAEARSHSTTTDVNYSAVQLASDAHGIPVGLLKGTYATNTIAGADKVSVQYVIDRLCGAGSEGQDDATLGPGACVLGDAYLPAGAAATELANAGATLSGTHAGVKPVTQQSVVYRLSVRVDGPRGTQSFYQSTFSIPS